MKQHIESFTSEGVLSEIRRQFIKHFNEIQYTGIKEEVLKIDDTAKPTFNPLTNFVGEGEYNIAGCGGIYTVINENNEQMAIKYHISGKINVKRKEVVNEDGTKFYTPEIKFISPFNLKAK